MAFPLRRDASLSARPHTSDLELLDPFGGPTAPPIGSAPRLRVVQGAEWVTDDEHPDFAVLPAYRPR